MSQPQGNNSTNIKILVALIISIIVILAIASVYIEMHPEIIKPEEKHVAIYQVIEYPLTDDEIKALKTPYHKWYEYIPDDEFYGNLTRSILSMNPIDLEEVNMLIEKASQSNYTIVRGEAEALANTLELYKKLIEQDRYGYALFKALENLYAGTYKVKAALLLENISRYNRFVDTVNKGVGEITDKRLEIMKEIEKLYGNISIIVDKGYLEAVRLYEECYKLLGQPMYLAHYPENAGITPDDVPMVIVRIHNYGFAEFYTKYVYTVLHEWLFGENGILTKYTTSDNNSITIDFFKNTINELRSKIKENCEEIVEMIEILEESYGGNTVLSIIHADAESILKKSSGSTNKYIITTYMNLLEGYAETYALRKAMEKYTITVATGRYISKEMVKKLYNETIKTINDSLKNIVKTYSGNPYILDNAYFSGLGAYRILMILEGYKDTIIIDAQAGKIDLNTIFYTALYEIKTYYEETPSLLFPFLYYND